MKELLPVLDYLHSINIIHRDISPGNVILPRQRSQPVLIDFGIVKEVASQIWSQQIGIQPASRVGKPGYASPEQMQLGQCYPCSDLYGLGMTALVLLTGRNPRWLLEQRFLAQPQTQISPPLVQILQKLLAENPRHRYASARSVLDDLNLLSAGQPGLPVPVSEPPSVTQALPEDTFLRLVSEPTQPSEPGQPSDALLEQFIQPCHRELVRCVGPMASYLLEDILTQQPQSPLQLIELLAAEIPDARQSTQFKQHAQAILKQLTLIPSPPIGQNAAQTQNPGSAQFSQSPSQHSGQPVANLPSPASTLTPEMIRCCRQELARQIGPMAICIVDDILAQSPQPTVAEFVQAVAAEIPEPKQAEAFRRQLIIQLEQLK
jgi:serine/threonine-protein kinase